MTERDGAGTDGERDGRQAGDGDDPLLVRPFLAGGASAETWPSSAARPPRPAADRHTPAHRAVFTPIALPGRPVAPEPAGPVRGAGRRRLMIVAGAGVAAVLALGAAGIAALRSGDDDGGSSTSLALPVASPSGAGSSSPAQSPAGPPASPTGAPPVIRRPGDADPARAPTGRPTAQRTPSKPVAVRTPGRAQAVAPGGAAATPAVDRTGVIGGPGDLCLDLNGNVASDGNFIQVYDCNGTSAQVWTVGADGTLRVDGRCAQSISGDNTVQIAGCDGRSSARWRAGSGRALVNVSTGLCLTDPANGGNRGTAVRLNACTGDGNQRWDLP